MSFAKGDTFLFSGENTSTVGMRLYIVLSDPSGTPPQIIVANITTANEDTDPTVVLEAGDHPFIKHPSAVEYRYACGLLCIPLREFEQVNASLPQDERRFIRHQQMRSEVVQRIIQGVFDSDMTPKKIQKALKKQIDAANPPP